MEDWLYAPGDVFTKAARFLVEKTSWFAVALSPVILILSTTMWVLRRATFRLIMVPVWIIFQLLDFLLLSTSRLWLKFPVVRPLFFIPGIIMAAISMLLWLSWQDPESGRHDRRLLIISKWPLSWFVVSSPSGEERIR